jgi:hypothetical protein
MPTDRHGRYPSPHGWTAEHRIRTIRRLEEIEQQLSQLLVMAEQDGHETLAYLISMAEIEARYVVDEHRKHLTS